MSRKLTTEFGPDVSDVKWTAELVSSYAVVSNNLTPEQLKGYAEMDRKDREINRRQMAEKVKLAKGRKIVRESSRCGSCLWFGALVRETEKFYVYEQISGLSDAPVGAPLQKRTSKSHPCVHLDPCPRCEDHPNTQYPRGYEG